MSAQYKTALAVALELGNRPAEVGHPAGVLRRRAARRAKGSRGRRRLRMGQAATAMASAVPVQDPGCFDIATGTIIGGLMDGIRPTPGQVSLYTDDAGYERAHIDVAGDNEADLPVCDSRQPNGGGGSNGGGGGGGGRPPWGFCSPTECETYENPPVMIGPDGCDIGYNGCGDTIGVNVAIPANATQDVNVPAAIEFTPRYFVYTGALQTFTINRIFVANGPNSNFGAGYSADYYALTSFTSKRVSWPTFYNSPPLSITVTNLTGQEANFQGLLIGVASHQ